MSWVLGPRYLLRRYCVLRLVDRLRRPACSRSAAARATCSRAWPRRGCEVVGVDSSPAARAEALCARGSAAPARSRCARSCRTGAFDLVMAFEVLEHIEDERGALASWVARVRPGGHLLLSVPAHHRRWGPLGRVGRSLPALRARRAAASGWRDAGLARRARLVVRLSARQLGGAVARLARRAPQSRARPRLTPAQRTARSGVERGALRAPGSAPGSRAR